MRMVHGGIHMNLLLPDLKQGGCRPPRHHHKVSQALQPLIIELSRASVLTGAQTHIEHVYLA